MTEADGYVKALPHISREGPVRGGKQVYQCSLRKRFGCKWRIRTSYNPERDAIRVETNNVSHSHAQGDEEHKRGLPWDVQKDLKEILKYNKNIKPSQAQVDVINLKPTTRTARVITLKKVQNFIKGHRRSAEKDWIEETTRGLADFIDGRQHGESIARDDDLVFLQSSNRSIQFDDDGGCDLQIFFSCRALLRLPGIISKTCVVASQLSVDSTYRIEINDRPVTVLGILDAAHQFVPIAFAITTRENTESYAHFFRTVKEAVFKECAVEFEPEFSMSDNNDAIFAALRAVHGEIIRGQCYPHLTRNLTKKGKARIDGSVNLPGVPEDTEVDMRERMSDARRDRNKIFKEIKKDIQNIHLACAPVQADIAKDLFLLKYSLQREFISAFKKEYMNGFKYNWGFYYGPHGIVTHNNGHENFNWQLKLNVTRGTRMKLTEILAGPRGFDSWFKTLAEKYFGSPPPMTGLDIRSGVRVTDTVRARQRNCYDGAVKLRDELSQGRYEQFVLEDEDEFCICGGDRRERNETIQDVLTEVNEFDVDELLDELTAMKNNPEVEEKATAEFAGEILEKLFKHRLAVHIVQRIPYDGDDSRLEQARECLVESDVIESLDDEIPDEMFLKLGVLKYWSLLRIRGRL